MPERADPGRAGRVAARGLLAGLSLLIASCSGAPPEDPERERRETEEILALEAVELRALPGEAPLIAAALGSPFPAVRARAARAAGRSPYFDDAAPIAALLAGEEDAPGILRAPSPRAAVRLEAAIACGRIGGPAAVEALGVATRREPAPDGRAAAIAALSGLPGAPFDRWPDWALREDDPLVRREAAFAALRRPELVPPDDWARFVAAEKDERVRWAIWHAMARSPVLRKGVEPALGAGDPNFLVSTFALEIPGVPPEKLLAIAGDPRRFWVERDAALRALAAVLPAAAPDRAAAIEGLVRDMAAASPGPGLPPPLRLRALSVLARARGDGQDASTVPGDTSPRGRLAALARLAEEEPGRLDASLLAGILAEPGPAAWPLRLVALRAAEGLGRDGLPLLERAIDDPVPVVSRSAWLRWRRLVGTGPPRPPRAGETPPYPFTPPVLARRARNPRAEVTIAGKGTIVIDLFAAEAPHHAASFTDLAGRGFYDGRRIERADATSGVVLCDARFEEGPVAGAPLPDEMHPSPILRGTVFSLHAAGLPDGPAPADRAPWTAAGSLAIAHVPLPELRGRATAWGQVALGVEVLDRIVAGDSIERVEIRDRVPGTR